MNSPDWTEAEATDFFKKKLISCSTARAKNIPQRISREKHRKRSVIVPAPIDQQQASGDDAELPDAEEKMHEECPSEFETKDGETFDDDDEKFDLKMSVETMTEVQFGEPNQNFIGNDDTKIELMESTAVASATVAKRKSSASAKGARQAKRKLTSRPDGHSMDPQFILNERPPTSEVMLV